MPVGRWNWTGEVGIIAFDRDLVRVDVPTYRALDSGYTIPVFESIAFASRIFCAPVWSVRPPTSSRSGSGFDELGLQTETEVSVILVAEVSMAPGEVNDVRERRREGIL